MGNVVKEITELFWGESTLAMGFLKFTITFCLIYVAFKIINEFLEDE